VDRAGKIGVVIGGAGIAGIAGTSTMAGVFFIWSTLGSLLIEAVVSDPQWKAVLGRIVLELSWYVSILAGVLVGWAVIRAVWPHAR
jgi:hypothetical protein